jgi:hypothetical protein
MRFWQQKEGTGAQALEEKENALADKFSDHET